MRDNYVLCVICSFPARASSVDCLHPSHAMRVAVSVGRRAESAAGQCSCSHACARLAAPRTHFNSPHPHTSAQQGRTLGLSACRAVTQSFDDVDAATHVVDVSYDDGFEGEFCSERPFKLHRSALTAQFVLSSPDCGQLGAVTDRGGLLGKLSASLWQARQHEAHSFVCLQCLEKLLLTTSPASASQS